VAAADGDNGRTVTVAVGRALVVSLANTYWRFQAAADPGVLRADGDQQVVASPPGACIPGGGCGTVSRRYVAVGSGTTTVTATRTTCGEALQCTPDQATYTLHVTVVAA
jgi:hypothetical protein